MKSEVNPHNDISGDKLSDTIVNNIGVGIVVVDVHLKVIAWNGFMELHSGISAGKIVEKHLPDYFPELPFSWLSWKVRNVFLLGSISYSSWKERPYLFAFRHNREITSTIENMYQDCSFMPIKNRDGEVTACCITIYDVTDVGIYQNALQDANDIIVVLEKMSHTDGLTGLNNRFHFESKLSEEFSRAKRYGLNLSLAIFDLDFFKTTNDTYGHPTGDAVLKEVAEQVTSALRSSDSVSRFGGEEFVIIFPETSLDSALMKSEQLRGKIEEATVQSDGRLVEFTASFGVASLDEDMANQSELLKSADSALYFSKENGRNKVSSRLDF